MAVLKPQDCWAQSCGAATVGSRLKRIVLSNFRNYSHCILKLDERSVVLTGRNGSGKTNILEAISLLAPGRGLRGAPFSDLPRLSGDGGWAVSAQLSLNGGDVAIGTGQQSHTPGSPSIRARTVRINGETASGSGALTDYLQVLWLIPAMDGLFTGPASERRRFIDRVVSSFDTSHRSRLNQFERAMRQRNKLLEVNERSNRIFDAIESQMAETGTAIAAARIETVERLSQRAVKNQSVFPRALLALEGTLEDTLREKPAIDAEDDYVKRLATSRDRDRAAGRTLAGPHRTDLLVRHGPKDMPAHLCSTGEQKALLIGLILAHAKAVKDAQGGVAPVLLLDEIAAHLDILRRETLFAEIDDLGAQAWLTGTDFEAFAPLAGKAQFFDIADGAAAATDFDETRRDVWRMGTG